MGHVQCKLSSLINPFAREHPYSISALIHACRIKMPHGHSRLGSNDRRLTGMTPQFALNFMSAREIGTIACYYIRGCILRPVHALLSVYSIAFLHVHCVCKLTDISSALAIYIYFFLFFLYFFLQCSTVLLILGFVLSLYN